VKSVRAKARDAKEVRKLVDLGYVSPSFEKSMILRLNLVARRVRKSCCNRQGIEEHLE
jgi:hypothetical protein